MKKILFYITGHGFGHTTRQMSVINKLFELDYEAEVIIKTNTPQWIYDYTLKKKFSFFPLKLDIGVVQNNFYDIDMFNTLRSFKELLDNEEKIIENELSFIKDNDVELIVGDIPPIAFEIGNRAGIPGIAVSNFTWDWIYEPYTEKFPEYKDIIPEMQEMYKNADLLLRLPFYGDMSIFRRIEDVPIVARKSKREKEEIKRVLDFPTDKKVVLISFGGFDKGEIDFSNLRNTSDYYFAATEQTGIHSRFIEKIENKRLIDKNLKFEDLVNSADAVITKPGYGIVSECIANKVPMIYVKRKNFREYDFMVEGLKRYLNSVVISNEDLVRCGLEKYLYKISENTQIFPEPDINGDEVIANFLVNYIS